MFHRSHPTASTGRDAPVKTCRHAAHVGTCGSCQRAQLERWSLQLAQAQQVRAAARA